VTFAWTTLGVRLGGILAVGVVFTGAAWGDTPPSRPSPRGAAPPAPTLSVAGAAGAGISRLIGELKLVAPNSKVQALSTSLGTTVGMLKEQASGVRSQAAKYPGWQAAIFEAVAKSYEGRSAEASSLSQAVLLVCPADAGAKTQPWLDAVVTEIKKSNESNKSLGGLLASGNQTLD
jgi:hypothetical protein